MFSFETHYLGRENPACRLLTFTLLYQMNFFLIWGAGNKVILFFLFPDRLKNWELGLSNNYKNYLKKQLTKIKI